MLCKESRIKEVSIYTDSQVSIQVIESFKPSPGHHIVDEFLDAIFRIKRRFPRSTISVKWIPGHEGVQGNEAAADTAKKAETDGSSHNAALPSLF